MLTYFTTRQRLSPDQIKSMLPGRFEQSPSIREVTAGIDNKPGMVFSASENHCGFYKDSQTWHRLGEFDGTEIYVGWNKLDPPKSDSLLRKEENLITGHRVILAGQSWMIPLAREWRLDD